MPRQSIIKIKAEIHIPYDRKKFGSASVAEKHCEGLQEILSRGLADATLAKWEPEHSSVEVETTEPMPAKK